MAGNCYRTRCRCTHTDPCRFGWIDLPARPRNGQHYDVVGPCPICRPEAAARLDAAAQKARKV